MIDLKLFTLIDKQLQKARGTTMHSIFIFGELSLVVIIGNFYQFAPVLGKTLWKHLYKKEKKYGKNFWSRFISILSLTK